MGEITKFQKVSFQVINQAFVFLVSSGKSLNNWWDLQQRAQGPYRNVFILPAEYYWKHFINKQLIYNLIFKYLIVPMRKLLYWGSYSYVYFSFSYFFDNYWVLFIYLFIYLLIYLENCCQLVSSWFAVYFMSLCF